jgi:hypothetical protein
MSLQIRSFAEQNQSSSEIPVDQVLDEYFLGKGGNRIVSCDMDETMFGEDLGTLVFLESLGDPKFWEIGVERFARLLLPNKFRGVIERAREGEFGENEIQKSASLLLCLHTDIVHLYTEQKRISKEWGEEKVDYFSEEEVNEFVFKMITFDEQIRLFLRILRSNGSVDGELLLRTRFFAGHNKSQIREMTSRALKVQRDEKLSFLQCCQNFPEGRLVRREEIQAGDIDRVIHVNDSIRRILMRIAFEYLVDTRVVTANLQGVGRTAVHETAYSALEAQRSLREDPSDIVLGTRLKMKADHSLSPIIDGDILIRGKKVESINRVRGTKILTAAFGDSLTDVAIGVSAMLNGGFFGITGRDYEISRRKIEPEIVRLLQSQGENADSSSLERRWEERVFFVPYSLTPHYEV